VLDGDPDSSTPAGDLLNRDRSLAPDSDLYVCGFPVELAAGTVPSEEDYEALGLVRLRGDRRVRVVS